MESNNQSFRFNTNINCSACVASVKPHLDRANGICAWQVDTNNMNKVLNVQVDGISRDEVADVVKKAGFKAEAIV